MSFQDLVKVDYTHLYSTLWLFFILSTIKLTAVSMYMPIYLLRCILWIKQMCGKKKSLSSIIEEKQCFGNELGAECISALVNFIFVGQEDRHKGSCPVCLRPNSSCLSA